MTLALLLDEYTLPDRGLVELHLNRSFTIQVTAEQARRQVKAWLLDQVSYMLTAHLPTLLLGERVVWRVPVVLTAAQVGQVGSVGTVDVDVESGAMNNVPACKDAILAQAKKWVATLPPYQPPTSTPPGWLAKDRKPTHPMGKPAGNPLDLMPATD